MLWPVLDAAKDEDCLPELVSARNAKGDTAVALLVARGLVDAAARMVQRGTRRASVGKLRWVLRTGVIRGGCRALGRVRASLWKSQRAVCFIVGEGSIVQMIGRRKGGQDTRPFFESGTETRALLLLAGTTARRSRTVRGTGRPRGTRGCAFCSSSARTLAWRLPAASLSASVSSDSRWCFSEWIETSLFEAFVDFFDQ